MIFDLHPPGGGPPEQKRSHRFFGWSKFETSGDWGRRDQYRSETSLLAEDDQWHVLSKPQRTDTDQLGNRHQDQSVHDCVDQPTGN